MAIIEHEQQTEVPAPVIGTEDPTDALVLERAAQLIEAGWTTGTYARDELDDCVDPTSEEANQFCLLGAVWRAEVELDSKGAGNFGVVERYVHRSIEECAQWNDGHACLPLRNARPGAREVAALLRSGAERARRGELVTATPRSCDD